MSAIYPNKKLKTANQTNNGPEMVDGKAGSNLQEKHGFGFVPIAVANTTTRRRLLIQTGSQEMVEAMGNMGIGGKICFILCSFAGHICVWIRIFDNGILRAGKNVPNIFELLLMTISLYTN